MRNDNNALDSCTKSDICETADAVVDRGTLGKICYGILGFVYAVIIYYIPVFMVASVISDTGSAALMKASIVIQFAVGLSVSILAYSSAWDRSFKLGMRACYGLVVGLVVALGAYSILTSI